MSNAIEDVTELKRIVAAYNATGRIAFLHPRKGTISLNGFPPLAIAQALAKMKDILAPEHPSLCQNCCSEVHPVMLTGYCIKGPCDRCRRLADLAMTQSDTRIVKRAIKREPGSAVGELSPLYLDCGCGHHLPIRGPVNLCSCGVSYDSRGYIRRSA